MNRSRLLELTAPALAGQDVQQLQAALIKWGYEIAIDGVFGPLTEWAVEKFQASVNLPVTGTVDTATERILFARPLRLSDPYLIGSDVREVQYLLSRIGYDVRVDGVFDPQTQRAVIQFQQYFQLFDDGVVQGKTLAQLLYLPVMAEVS